jgi:hypothetical protein
MSDTDAEYLIASMLTFKAQRQVQLQRDVVELA